MTWDPVRVKPGTVGRAIPGMELRLADDGEVLGRGGNVFRGYLDDPERTAEALDADGWLHTGDIGELDDDGYLRIVDRKKELIITAGGKNVSPANLEAALKAQPLIGQACVVGDGEPFLAALLVLDPDVAPVWARGHGATGVDAGRARGGPGGPGRGRARGRRRQRALLARGADPRAFTVLPRRVAARLRGAHADDEAQAPRHRGQVRDRDRGLLPRVAQTRLVGDRDVVARVPGIARLLERMTGARHQLGRIERVAAGSRRCRPTRSASRPPGSARSASRTRSATITRARLGGVDEHRDRDARRPAGTPRRSRAASATPPRRAR